MTLYIETFVRAALSQSGDRYGYGAEVSLSDPDPKAHGRAFDCSELTQWAAAITGGYLPDGSEAQYEYCRAKGTVVSVDRAEHTRGALLFLGHPATEHVVIGLGNGRTIEARGAAWGVGSWDVFRDAWTAAALVPGYDYATPPAPPTPSGHAFVVHLQAALGMPARAQDGHWGPITERELVRHRFHSNDRVVARVQRVLGVRVDGDWGPRTEAAYEAAHHRYYGR